MAYEWNYGKLAYAKVEAIERRLQALEEAGSGEEEAETTAPRLYLPGGGVRGARVDLVRDADLAVRVAMHVSSLAGGTLSARLTVDGREAGECSDGFSAGETDADFLFTVRALERGEHALLLYVACTDEEAVVTAFSLRLIGAGASFAAGEGRMAVAAGEGRQFALALSGGRIALYEIAGESPIPVPASFPTALDADLAFSGGLLSVSYVTAYGQALVDLFDADGGFRKVGSLFLGGGAEGIAAAEHGGAVEIVLLEGRRAVRAAAYPALRAAGRADERESEIAMRTVSLASDGERLLLAAEYEGTARLFRSYPLAEAISKARAAIRAQEVS